MSTKRPTRVLLTSLRADGGVGAMQQVVISLLESCGCEVSLAYYEPFKRSPALSVPLSRLGLFGRPALHRTDDGQGHAALEVGVRVPELEWARYRYSPQWREALQGFDAHVAICGAILPAAPIIAAGLPCVAWVATAFDGDRNSRIRTFPLRRRLVDRLLDAPLCRRLERRLLWQCRLLSLSEYTRRTLLDLQPAASRDLLGFPIDTTFFSPGDRAPMGSGPSWRIGVVGRLSDPRKNIDLALATLGQLRQSGRAVTGVFVGHGEPDALRNRARSLALEGAVEIHAPLPNEALLATYRSLDCLLISSTQEGLSLVGLEAMACGAPVVSTTCGGPEEYVLEGQTGFLADHSASALASALNKLIASPGLANHLGLQARQLVTSRYTYRLFARTFLASLASSTGLFLEPDPRSKWY